MSASAKQTLRKKLGKALTGVDQKVTPKAESALSSDIEDGGGATQYFSPVQTRRQRKDKQTLKEEGTSIQPATKPHIKTENPTNTAKKVLPIKIQEEEANVSGKAEKWDPPKWREMLANIRTMRSRSAAPVDTMGCHQCSDANADEKTQRFHKLVALMLSSQTKDETTFAAMQRLKAQNLTPANLLSQDVTALEQLLNPVSFYKNKAKYLQKTAQILVDKYNSDIPNTIKDLVALPGVGPKMAHICMATAWNETTGIGVDVHVHRISNRLRWLPQPTKEPDQTRRALEAWLPRDLWREVNHLLVGFGQTVCTPLQPHCVDCLNRELCPFSTKKSSLSAERKRSSAGEDVNSDADGKAVSAIVKQAKFQKKKM